MNGRNGNMTSVSSQALQLWEVCNTVTSHVDYADAVSLVSTSRAFFDCAVKHVWGDRAVPADDMLKLLPGFNFSNWYHRATLELKIPRPLPTTYLDRLRIYAPHVKELKYQLAQPWLDNEPGQGFQYHPEDIKILRDVIGSTVLLPRLTSVALGRSFPTLHPMYDLRLLGLLVPPTLTRFSLVENASLFRFHSEPFFEFLGSRIIPSCTELQDLSLLDAEIGYISHAHNRDREEKAYPFDNLPIPKRLSHFAFGSGVLNVKLLEWIANAPNLSTLTMRNLWTVDRPILSQKIYLDSSFQNLRVLHLEQCEVKSAIALWNTSLVCRIEQLSFSVYATYTAQIEPLFGLFASQSRQLTKLKITRDGKDRWEAEKMCFSSTGFNPEPHMNLVDCSFDDLYLTGSNPVCALATAWPSMRRLDLGNYLIELEDFEHLPAYLIHLEYFCVRLPGVLGNPKEIGRLVEGVPRSSAMSALILNASPSIVKKPKARKDEFYYQLARYFARWWPNLQLLTPANPTRGREIAWQEACGYINQKVLELSV